MVYVTELRLVMYCRRYSNILVCDDVIARRVKQKVPTQNVYITNYANYHRPKITFSRPNNLLQLTQQLVTPSAPYVYLSIQ